MLRSIAFLSLLALASAARGILGTAQNLDAEKGRKLNALLKRNLKYDDDGYNDDGSGGHVDEDDDEGYSSSSGSGSGSGSGSYDSSSSGSSSSGSSSHGKGKGKGLSKSGKGKGKGLGKSGISKGKGKGKSGGGKSGKGKGGGKSGKAGSIAGNWDDDFYPTVEDSAFFDDEFFDDQFFEDDDCELVTFNESFSIGPYTNHTFDGLILGSTFVWSPQYITELEGTVPIEGVHISGYCVRTDVESDDSFSAGTCQFTFKSDDGFTISVAGCLDNKYHESGSPLAITGGTGGVLGITGEFFAYPVYHDDGGTMDVLLDAVGYEIYGALGLIVCPTAQHR